MSLPDDHIRLVSTHDDVESDGIKLSREHILQLPAQNTENSQMVESFSKPSYIALSYVWGIELDQIMCDRFAFDVSSNLPAALKAIHKYFPGHFVWTDSLSINQKDIGEKSYQVSIMDRIFSHAETVVIWLGHDMEDIYNELIDLTRSPQTDESSSTRRQQFLQKLVLIPWFFRAWTFQEIRLANNALVLMGSHKIPWEDFIQKIQLIRNAESRFSSVPIRSQPRSNSPFPYVVQDRFFFAIFDELNAGSSSDLADLLFITWYRDATEKRDKVYSVLSSELLSAKQHGISVDYKIQWSSLCIKAARACIKTSENLKILKIAGMMLRWKSPLTNRWDANELNQLLDHPSWAPDWWRPPQQTRSRSPLLYDERGIFQYLDFCCPPRASNQQTDHLSPFLVLRGVFLGLINCETSPTYPGGPIYIHPAPQCTNLVQEVLTDPTNQQKALAKVFMPHFISAVDSHLQSDCSCVPFNQRKVPGSLMRGQFHFSPMNASPELHFSHDGFALRHTSKPTGTSEDEFPAEVLAESVESGDWLVLLEGGGLPFVVRPVKDSHGRIPPVHEFDGFNAGESLPNEAGMFVLVDEASMNFDELWPCNWNAYCRAGTFVLV